MPFDATVGGASATSYCDLATAEAYFAARPFSSAWAGTDSVKQTAFMFATTLLEREKWAGAKGMTPAGALAQALAWPRRWAPTLEADANPQWVTTDWVDISVTFYSELTIPTPIVRATCELALVILANGSADPFTTDAVRVKRKRVDVLETEYFDSQDRVRGLGHFPHVARLVAHLLRDTDRDVLRA